MQRYFESAFLVTTLVVLTLFVQTGFSKIQRARYSYLFYEIPQRLNAFELYTEDLNIREDYKPLIFSVQLTQAEPPHNLKYTGFHLAMWARDENGGTENFVACDFIQALPQNKTWTYFFNCTLEQDHFNYLEMLFSPIYAPLNINPAIYTVSIQIQKQNTTMVQIYQSENQFYLFLGEFRVEGYQTCLNNDNTTLFRTEIINGIAQMNDVTLNVIFPTKVEMFHSQYIKCIIVQQGRMQFVTGEYNYTQNILRIKQLTPVMNDERVIYICESYNVFDQLETSVVKYYYTSNSNETHKTFEQNVQGAQKFTEYQCYHDLTNINEWDQDFEFWNPPNHPILHPKIPQTMSTLTLFRNDVNVYRDLQSLVFFVKLISPDHPSQFNSFKPQLSMIAYENEKMQPSDFIYCQLNETVRNLSELAIYFQCKTNQTTVKHVLMRFKNVYTSLYDNPVAYTISLQVQKQSTVIQLFEENFYFYLILGQFKVSGYQTCQNDDNSTLFRAEITNGVSQLHDTIFHVQFSTQTAIFDSQYINCVVLQKDNMYFVLGIYDYQLNILRIKQLTPIMEHESVTYICESYKIVDEFEVSIIKYYYSSINNETRTTFKENVQGAQNNQHSCQYDLTQYTEWDQNFEFWNPSKLSLLHPKIPQTMSTLTFFRENLNVQDDGQPLVFLIKLVSSEPPSQFNLYKQKLHMVAYENEKLQPTNFFYCQLNESLPNAGKLTTYFLCIVNATNINYVLMRFKNVYTPPYDNPAAYVVTLQVQKQKSIIQLFESQLYFNLDLGLFSVSQEQQCLNNQNSTLFRAEIINGNTSLVNVVLKVKFSIQTAVFYSQHVNCVILQNHSANFVTGYYDYSQNTLSIKQPIPIIDYQSVIYLCEQYKNVEQLRLNMIHYQYVSIDEKRTTNEVTIQRVQNDTVYRCQQDISGSHKKTQNFSFVNTWGLIFILFVMLLIKFILKLSLFLLYNFVESRHFLQLYQEIYPFKFVTPPSDCDYTCPICLDKIDEEFVFQTDCNHQFHEICFQQWYKDHNTCPCCRSDLSCTRKFIIFPLIYEVLYM